MKNIPLLSILMLSSSYSMDMPAIDYSVESPENLPSAFFLADPVGQIGQILEKKQFMSQMEDHVEKICTPLMSLLMNMDVKAAHVVPQDNPNNLLPYYTTEHLKKFYDLRENFISFLNKEKNSFSEDIFIKSLIDLFEELPTKGRKSRPDILEISKYLLRILTILKSTSVSEINDSDTYLPELQIMKGKINFITTCALMDSQESSFSDLLHTPEKITIDGEAVRKSASRLEQQISHLPEFQDELQNTMLGLLKMNTNLTEMRSDLNFCRKAFTATKNSAPDDMNPPLEQEFEKLIHLEGLTKEKIRNIKFVLNHSKTILENLEKTVDSFEKEITDLRESKSRRDLNKLAESTHVVRETSIQVDPRDRSESDPFVNETLRTAFILQLRDHLNLMSSPLMKLMMANTDSSILNSPASPQFKGEFHTLREKAIGFLAKGTNKFPEDSVLKCLNALAVEMGSLKLHFKGEASGICKQLFGIMNTIASLLHTGIDKSGYIYLSEELLRRLNNIRIIIENPQHFKIEPEKNIEGPLYYQNHQRATEIDPVMRIEALRNRANKLEEQSDYLPEFYDTLEQFRTYLIETKDDLDTVSSKFEFFKNESTSKIYDIDDICPENDVSVILLEELDSLLNLRISVENKDKDIGQLLLALKVIIGNREKINQFFNEGIDSFNNEAIGHELLLSDSQKKSKPVAPQAQKETTAPKITESECKALINQANKLEKQLEQFPTFYNELEKLQSYLQKTTDDAEKIMSELEFHRNEIATKICDIDDLCPENDMSSILLTELGSFMDLTVSEMRKAGDVYDVLFRINRIIGNMENISKSIHDKIGDLKSRAVAGSFVLSDSQKGSKPSAPQNKDESNT